MPYANFWAWFWVVSSFSLGYRLVALRSDWIGKWLAPLSGIVVGLACVLFTNAFITYIIPFDYHTLTIAPVLLSALFIVIVSRPRFYQTSIDPLALWVPFLSHFYLLAAGLISGVILNPPALLWIAISMFILALVLHKPSIQHIFFPNVESGRR